MNIEKIKPIYKKSILSISLVSIIILLAGCEEKPKEKIVYIEVPVITNQEWSYKENAEIKKGESLKKFSPPENSLFNLSRDDFKKALEGGVNSFTEKVNWGIEDSVYAIKRISKEIVLKNIVDYGIDKKTKEIWINVKENNTIKRYVIVVEDGHEKVLSFLERITK